MEVLNEEDISILDAKKIMEDRKKVGDLVYEQKICLEYLEKVCKMPATKLKSMLEDLSKIAILKPRYIALIVNMLPDTEEEVGVLFSKERTNLKKEEIKQIVDIVKKYK
jgi:DNA-directed RNA polymerase subunit F